MAVAYKNEIKYEDYVGLLKKTAGKYAHNNRSVSHRVAYDDLVTIGYLEFENIKKSYKRDKGVEFSTYFVTSLSRIFRRYIYRHSGAFLLPFNNVVDQIDRYRFKIQDDEYEKVLLDDKHKLNKGLSRIHRETILSVLKPDYTNALSETEGEQVRLIEDVDGDLRVRMFIESLPLPHQVILTMQMSGYEASEIVSTLKPGSEQVHYIRQYVRPFLKECYLLFDVNQVYDEKRVERETKRLYKYTDENIVKSLAKDIDFNF